jgi:LPS sulfotransferase NodH
MESNMSNHLLIAAHPRSGSTYLCHLLGQFEQTEVLLEIFHTNPNVIKQHLKEAYPKVIQKLGLSGSDESIRNEIISKNCQYTKILSSFYPSKTLVYKLFPGHLPPTYMQEQIKNSRFVLLLKRNLLHSYISDDIATTTQKWAWADTTSILATFSQEKFIQHVFRTRHFYTNIENIAKKQGKKIVVINYEGLIKSKTPYQYLSDLLAGSLKLNLPATTNTFSNTLQDRREMAKAKVENPIAMEVFLNSVGLSTLDNGKNFLSDKDYDSALEQFR